MKKLGYYPALIFLVLFCASVAGAFVFLSAQTMKRMSGYKGSDAAYKATLKQLDDEKKAMENNQQTDKSYNDYFNRWRQKEGVLDETKLKERLQKIAEDLGVSIYEVVPLDAPEKEEGANAKPSEKKVIQRPRLGIIRPGDGVNVGDNALRGKAEMIELRITALGPFSQLMAWMERAENELGGLRIVRTSWVARSTEEVKLTVGLRYKIVGGIQ